jgi:hypothetical protein
MLTGHEKILKEGVFSNDNEELLEGTNSVQSQISLRYKVSPVRDNRAELVAGILRFELHQKTFNGVPSIQPHHIWASIDKTTHDEVPWSWNSCCRPRVIVIFPKCDLIWAMTWSTTLGFRCAIMVSSTNQPTVHCGPWVCIFGCAPGVCANQLGCA